MNILQEIIERKRKDIENRKKRYFHERKTFQTRGKKSFLFSKTIGKRGVFPHLIAEIKPKSPSKGKLFSDDDTIESIARLYKEEGVHAISVLTDEPYFGGSLNNLTRVRNTVGRRTPILMKDFVLDEIQIYEAHEHGANAVLLMRSVLSTEEIERFLGILEDLGMDGLVETHDEKELFDVVKNTSAKVIGINNRDLKTLKINQNAFHLLLEKLPEEEKKGKVFVCESGIHGRDDIRKYARNAHAVLVGTGIIASENRGETIRELVGKPKVKICGTTNIEDAVCSAENTDYLGFVFVEESPRFIPENVAREIVAELKKNESNSLPKMVGVFVNPSLFLLNEYRFLDVFQLHGDESIDFCREIQEKFPNKEIWKAIRIQSEYDLKEIPHYSFCDAVIVDAFSESARGGTGKRISPSLLQKIPMCLDKDQIFFLAGGISQKNIKNVLQYALPDGIDLVSSLEEKPGKKSKNMIIDFFTTLRKTFL